MILDEVVEPLKIKTYDQNDYNILKNENMIIVNEDLKVSFIAEEYNGNAFKDIKEYCHNSVVYLMNEKFFIWLFPIAVFKSFKEIQILTYLFNGSSLRYYFDLNNVEYQIKKEDSSKQIESIKSLLNIYSGLANNTGNSHYAFSKNWIKNKSNKQLNLFKVSATNLVKRNFKTKSESNAFTTFKDHKNKLSGRGYTRGFISLNARATNDYEDKETMLYLANRFLKPEIVNFYRFMDLKIDEDLWSLSEMLQWIWRGRIRKGESMNLFIPSKRMRNLLYKWLDGKVDSQPEFKPQKIGMTSSQGVI